MVSRPALRLAAEEPDQVPRLLAFRAAHPGMITGPGEFGTWQALIPEENGAKVEKALVALIRNTRSARSSLR